MKAKEIYLDYASSALSFQANPGVVHQFGMKEKNKLKKARGAIAKVLSACEDEIIFTSGSTESNNLAIQGVVNAILDLTPSPISLPRRGVGERWIFPHIVTTNIEHSSVLEVCRHLEKTKQAKVTYVDVEKNGIVDPKKIKKALRPETILVSVMYANNEIGTIEPIQEIAKEIRHYKKTKSVSFLNGLAGVGDLGIRGPEKNLPTSFSFPVFHTDATQAVNYLPINVQKLGVDLFSFNGAKIYGPKGVGVLYVKKNTPIQKIMFGGDQEFGFRPGTENVGMVAGLAEALKITEKIKEKEVKRLTQLRDYFFAEMSKRHFDITINGDLKNRLPNNVNVTFGKIPSDLLVIELSEKGIMASSKSACKSSEAEGSYVIEAINKLQGLASQNEIGGVRFSLGRETIKKDIDYTAKALSEILQKLKKWYD